MKPATIISLAVSLLLGVGAIFLGRGYMASGGAKASATAAPAIEMTKLLVVAKDVEAGALVEPGMFKLSDWPAANVPAGALTATSELGEKAYARAAMVPGELVLQSKLDKTGASLTLAAAITPGMRAVAVVVENDTGVAGWVLPGDLVDVHEYVQLELIQGREKLDPDAARISGDMVARPVLKNVRVLAVDQTFDPNLEGAVPANTVTLEVSPEGALAVGLASQRSGLGLALIGLDEAALPPAPPELKKSAARPSSGPKPRAAASEPSNAQVRVIHGTKEESVTTPNAAQAQPAAEKEVR